MKGRTIILDHIQDREAAALMVDGKLEDFADDFFYLQRRAQGESGLVQGLQLEHLMVEEEIV